MTDRLAPTPPFEVHAPKMRLICYAEAMKTAAFFGGLTLAFYIVNTMFGFLGCAVMVALLVLVERERAIR